MLGFGVLCARAATSPERESRPFLVESYRFDYDGHCVGSGKNFATRITGFIYGERLTDTLFYPARERFAHAAANTPGAKAALPPARPPQSRFTADRWTRENGLPANKIRALCQTEDGYLWVGTVAGLARFDGVSFTVFDETNSPAMAANGSVVRALAEDGQGRLWIGTRRGLLCREGGRFVSFPGQAEWRGRMINGLARRAAGGVWVAYDQGVNWQDGQGSHGLPVTGVQRPFSVCEQVPDTLWIGARNGLFEWNLPARSVVRMALEGAFEPQSIEDFGVYHLRMDRRHRLWVGSRRGVVVLVPGASPKLRTFWKKAGLAVPCDSRFAEDRIGRIWATTQALGGVVLFPHGPSSAEWVQTPVIQDAICILADRDGAIWVGTHEGLVRLREKLFTPVRFEGIDLFGGPMQAMAEGPGAGLFFVAGQFVGLWRGRTIHVADLAPMLDGALLPGVIARFADRVWAGDPRGGLFAIPDFEHQSPHQTSIRAVHRELGRVRALHAGRSGALWVASERGLFLMTGNGRLREIPAASSLKIHALLEDASGGLWIGGANGVARLEDGLLHPLADSSNPPPEAFCLAQDASGNLWEGTGEGLRVWRGGRWYSFGSGSGVPQEAIQSIVQDRFQRLWLHHESGVARVAISELKAWLRDTNQVPAVARFAAADGLPGSNLGEHPHSALAGRDGRLWFARGNELAVVEPAHCPPGRPPPTPKIQNVAINGKQRSPDRPINWSRGQLESLVFQFTALGLKSPERSLIQFRLDGVDPDWRNAGSRRRAIYSHVPPGRYRFRVRARNDAGQWSRREGGLEIRVRSPFWQTGPAQLAGGLLLATGLAGIGGALAAVRRRLRQRQERVLNEHRERLARNLHDHFAPRLSEIALAGRLEEAAHAAAEICAKELREMIWEVHPENDTLPRLLDFFADFAQRHLGAAGVSLELDLPSQPESIPLPPSTRREASGLFKEAVRNVIRHAGASQAVVAARCDGQQLEFSVSDNGRGFDLAGVWERAPKALGGHGLRNFQARCRGLGGRCEVRTAPGQGARVTFTLPLA